MLASIRCLQKVRCLAAYYFGFIGNSCDLASAKTKLATGIMNAELFLPVLYPSYRQLPRCQQHRRMRRLEARRASAPNGGVVMCFLLGSLHPRNWRGAKGDRQPRLVAESGEEKLAGSRWTRSSE